MEGLIKHDRFFWALAANLFKRDGFNSGKKGNIWFDLEKFEEAAMLYLETTLIEVWDQQRQEGQHMVLFGEV